MYSRAMAAFESLRRPVNSAFSFSQDAASVVLTVYFTATVAVWLVIATAFICFFETLLNPTSLTLRDVRAGENDRLQCDA